MVKQPVPSPVPHCFEYCWLLYYYLLHQLTSTHSELILPRDVIKAPIFSMLIGSRYMPRRLAQQRMTLS